MKLENTKMCIYQIKHKISGKCYIGQTTNKVGNRWKIHGSSNSKCPKISNAIKKHGKEAFDFNVIEECETVDQLNEREEHWIKELNTLSPNGYNLKFGGENKKLLEETKKKLSESHKGKIFSDSHIESMRVAQTGRKHSEETKTKMRNQIQSTETKIKRSISLSGKKRSEEITIKMRDRKHTPESKQKMSVSRKGKCLSENHVLKMSEARLAKRDTMMNEEEFNKCENARLRMQKSRANKKLRLNQNV